MRIGSKSCVKSHNPATSRQRYTDACVALAFTLAMLCAGPALGQGAVDDGFEVDVYAEDLNQPIALAWAPDGRLFVAERGGTIRVIQNDQLREEPFAQIEVFEFGEGGLLGLALDPDFANNGFVYAFATISDEEQRIVRWQDVDNVGQNETVIRANLPTTGTIHNAGGLRFAPDGTLYFSIGDIGIRETSQQIQSLAGKICRITADGTAPADNPFQTPTGVPRAVFAMGFRNPFRFCFAPDGRLFVMDVGSTGDAQREEINLVEAGKNYGWPEVEGISETASQNGFENPILSYKDEGSSIAGCVYYDDDRYPAQYAGNIFHIDYVSQTIYRVVLDGNTVVSHELFVEAENGPVDLAMGLDGNLYYTELFSGRIMRVRSTAPHEERGPVESTPEENSAAPLGLCGIGVVQSGITAMLVLAALVCTKRRRR
ncbi:MAG: PQQ-dependent sugar dehydrogenase [Planctomycetes bacterium]|nr:PQQ-dependent sugar dehydrogenase [Planctomycetota bacterium]